jgi:hypothetical protein
LSSAASRVRATILCVSSTRDRPRHTRSVHVAHPAGERFRPGWEKEAVPPQFGRMASFPKTTPDVPAGHAAEPSRTSGNSCRPLPENGKLLSAKETVKEAVPHLQNTRPESPRHPQRTSPSVFMALVHQIFDLEATEFVPTAKFPNMVDSFGNGPLPYLLDGARPRDHLDVMVEARLRACASAASRASISGCN